MSTNQRGYFLEVYRNSSGDCSNRGLSSIHNEIFVICEGEHAFKCFPLGAKDSCPWAEQDAIRRGVPIFEVGIAGNRYHFKPKGETRWTMFGGNFAYCSDSRTPSHPIHIHDRIE